MAHASDRPESRVCAFLLVRYSNQCHKETGLTAKWRSIARDSTVGVPRSQAGEGAALESATWLHKAREIPKAEFRREVEKELTGKDREPSEQIYFKAYKSQIPVIEQAIEAVALMLGSDKSRGYCLEMIYATSCPGRTSTAATRRYCCSPSRVTTGSCPAQDRSLPLGNHPESLMTEKTGGKSTH